LTDKIVFDKLIDMNIVIYIPEFVIGLFKGFLIGFPIAIMIVAIGYLIKRSRIPY
jgi:hypothetical protein